VSVRCFRPADLPEALAILDAERPKALAGGTDFYPALRDAPVSSPVLDLSRLDALRGVCRAEGGWRFGALVTWTEARRAALPPAFDSLKQAAGEVGGVQIQNAGTLGGNLCNASPAADGVPPWLALDAEVELASLRGVRRMPLDAFLLGPRRTALEADELLTAILVPDPPEGARSAFVKLGARAYLVISIGMVAALVAAEGGRVTMARVAVGACSAVAQRLPALEAALIGLPADGGALAAAVRSDHLAALSPIDDVRAPAAYRRTAALELVRRALAAAVAREPVAA
jgi:CO/xanthine dehydrogenase FAD-binding subunit